MNKLINMLALTWSLRIPMMLVYLWAYLVPSRGLPQELILFEPTELNKQDEGSLISSSPRRDRDGNLITGPEFTLIGTTRISDDYIVVLKDRTGEALSVKIEKGVSTPIPGRDGFQILAVGPKGVSLQYPGSIRCVVFENQGVSCDSTYRARLSLTTLTPLASSSSSSVLSIGENTGASQGGDEDGTLINPFEAFLERAANTDSRADSGAFEPVRINPEDIPPGMKVVSTPFGDRLVEDD